MNEEKLLEYFNENIKEVFRSSQNESLFFIRKYLNDEKITAALAKWPKSLRLLIVKRHLQLKQGSNMKL